MPHSPATTTATEDYLSTVSGVEEGMRYDAAPLGDAVNYMMEPVDH